MSAVARVVVGRLNRRVRSKKGKIARVQAIKDVGEYEYYLAIAALSGR